MQQLQLGLYASREADHRANQDQSRQAVSWREERAALLDRAALLEDRLAAGSASAAAAAKAVPRGCLCLPAPDVACALAEWRVT